MILRPDALVLPGGSFAEGLEVCLESGAIAEVRPWSSAVREEAGLLLSPAFVNAHSHLEYRDLMGQIAEPDYWPWIRAITEIKPTRSLESVQAAAIQAAHENVAAGVTLIGEISDWPVSGLAMRSAGLNGVIFQEVITVAESDSPLTKLSKIEAHRALNEATSGVPAYLSAHAPYTVAPEIITQIAQSGKPHSIHVAESPVERQLYERGEGPIADMYAKFGTSFTPPNCSSVKFLNTIGALTARTQLVHVCDADADDIAIIAASGATVVHCPRSNDALNCPAAPMRELLAAGVTVGLGLDSAASSGPIDMFLEMQAALAVSRRRSNPLSAEEVWRMATTAGAASIFHRGPWEIAPGSSPDLMLLSGSGRDIEHAISGTTSVERLIRSHTVA